MNLKSFLLAATVTVTLFSCRDIREGTADPAAAAYRSNATD